MTIRVATAVTPHTLSFFAAGRLHSMSSSHPNFDRLRTLLVVPKDQDHDVDAMLALVDLRVALAQKSQGEIVLDEASDTILWRGQPLHNVWVEKILAFREAGEDFEPIWNALAKLVHNPTPAAIERLPIFLERTALGFLPDGRFLAFKGVDRDFFSAHANPDGSKFRHQVGDQPRLARDQVDPNPNATCSTGLHVGAPDYVKDHYSGARYQLVLVAVDPVDVVAVPVDYNGGKMRVTGYEVISHLSQDYNDELLGSLRNTYTDYTSSEREAHEDDEDESENDHSSYAYNSIKLGDVIKWIDRTGATFFGTVMEVPPNLDDAWIKVRDVDNAETDVTEEEFIRVVEPEKVTGAMVAFEGCIVQVMGHDALRDGVYVITGLNEDDLDGTQEDGDAAFFSIRPQGADEDSGTWPLTNGLIHAVSSPHEGHIWPAAPRIAAVGDRVRVAEGGWPPAGVYEVISVGKGGYVVRTQYDGDVNVNFAQAAPL